MSYPDLRKFISRLDKEGELARVRVEVDPQGEIGAIMRRVLDRRGKAVLFENVKGCKIPLLCGAMAIYKRYGLALGFPQDIKSIMHKALAAAREPVQPVLVEEGPCQQQVFRDEEVDLFQIPAPVWHPLDGGPYLGTLGVVIVRDPETGVGNAAIYRHQLLGKNKLGLLASQHIGRVLAKYLERGRPMPVATVIGTDPAVLAASVFHLPYGEDELAVAGALQREPVQMIRCKTIDLEVPAHSEIVLESEVILDSQHWEKEGPFGEFTGFYAGQAAPRPTLMVKAITTRTEPICQGTLEGRPPAEGATLKTVGHSVATWLKLERGKVPGFQAVFLPESGSGTFIAIMALDKQHYPGNANQALAALWGLDRSKWVIIVDSDVDIFDPAQVEWALATRVQPHRDIMLTPASQPIIGLDPSLDPHSDKSSRIGIDATRQFKGFEFPEEITWPAEQIELSQKRWADYGL